MTDGSNHAESTDLADLGAILVELERRWAESAAAAPVEREALRAELIVAFGEADFAVAVGLAEAVELGGKTQK